MFVFPRLVVIDDLYVVNPVSLPTKADTPLIVDPNAVLSSPITLQRLQTISRRRIQFIEASDRVDLDESTDRYSCYRIPAPALSGLEKGSGLLGRKTSDHLHRIV
jgi:hypothetical protein